jgi:hypothetical protein
MAVAKALKKNVQEWRYVDTVAEKQTKTVSRQKCTVPETTHDMKTRNTLSRQKKSETRVAAEKNLARPKYCLSEFFFRCGVYCARDAADVPFFCLFLTNENWAWA